MGIHLDDELAAVLKHAVGARSPSSSGASKDNVANAPHRGRADY